MPDCYRVDCSALVPGVTVWVRYGTTQKASFAKKGWRKVYVLALGTLSETDFFNPQTLSGDETGYWVVDNGVRKFFVKFRICEVSDD